MKELQSMDTQSRCIASDTPELLSNLMLDIGLSNTDVYQYPYYLDESANYFMVDLDHRVNQATLTGDMHAKIKHHKHIFYANPEKFSKRDDTLGNLIPLVLGEASRYIASRSPESC